MYSACEYAFFMLVCWVRRFSCGGVCVVDVLCVLCLCSALCMRACFSLRVCLNNPGDPESTQIARAAIVYIRRGCLCCVSATIGGRVEKIYVHAKRAERINSRKLIVHRRCTFVK